jgi:hypothetical protein
MMITFEVFNGLGISLEYVAKNLEHDIDESVVILELACFRWIFWTGDFE